MSALIADVRPGVEQCCQGAGIQLDDRRPPMLYMNTGDVWSSFRHSTDILMPDCIRCGRVLFLAGGLKTLSMLMICFHYGAGQGLSGEQFHSAACLLYRAC